MNVAEALEIENSINTLFFASSLASYFVCSTPTIQRVQ